MSSESQENNELQKLLNSYAPSSDDANIDTNNDANKPAMKHVLTPDLLANSVASITKMLARKSGIEALAFTEEDKKKLESERKKKSIDEKRKEYKENIAKNEVENDNTMIVKSNSAIMM